MAGPLIGLTREQKSVMTQWNAEIKEAFLKLKAALCQHPVLVALDFPQVFIVQTNTSNEGLGVVLSQEVKQKE